jgi:transposase
VVSLEEHQRVLGENAALHGSVAELSEQLRITNERLDQLLRALLGQKTERSALSAADADQLGLFDPPSAVATNAAAPPPATEVAAHTRQASPRADHPGRKPLPAHLERRIELIDPPGITGTLVADGQYTYPGYDILGTEVSERLVVVPAEVYVLETHRVKLLDRQTRTIHIGQAPDRVLAKSQADESLGVDLIVKKYVEHLPLYRQAERLQRDYGVDIPRTTLGSWVDRIATVLQPLHAALRHQVFAASYVQMDESGILVLDTPPADAEQSKSQKSRRRRPPGEPPRRHRGYMWLTRDPVNEAVLFAYHPGRGHELPLALLENYRGYLQVDGYAAYRTALRKLGVTDEDGARIRLVGCMAHIRRKFFEAKGSHPKEAEQALKTFRAIYRVEKEARKLSAAERLVYRQEHLQPLLADFATWLEGYRERVLPKGLFATAINYALGQWPRMGTVLEDGRIEVDNNAIENKVRPLALGRKNYLFCGSHRAAENAAVLYSLLATCKARRVNPREWLQTTLDRILSHPINRIEELLPGYTKPKADGQDGVG